MLMFSITGITLNHAAQIAAKPDSDHARGETARAAAGARCTRRRERRKRRCPPPSIDWIEASSIGVLARRPRRRVVRRRGVCVPAAPGRRCLAEHRPRERRGAVRAHGSRLDLLSQRSAQGPQCRRRCGAWFIDVFAVACVLFAGTGLFLLKMHSGRRPSTWPLVAPGGRRCRWCC